MIRKTIKENILNQKQKADELVLIMTETVFIISYEEFFILFRHYVAVKFFLEVEEIVTDNFYEICQMSVNKMLKLPQEEKDASMLASKCGGATDAMNKKIFFILAVKKEFVIEIEPEEAVAVNTMQQLVGLVYEKIRGKVL